MRQWSLCLLTALIIVSTVSAQDLPAEDKSPANGIFPLTLVLEAASYTLDGGGAWQPDWPLALPPDAFKVRNGEVSGIQIEGEAVSLNCRFDSLGRIEEFPFMLNGSMARVSFVYRSSESSAEVRQDRGSPPGIREMKVTFPAVEEPEASPVAGEEAGASPIAGDEVSYGLEFLELSDSQPVLARASLGDAWYFIYFSRGVNEAAETWYDEEGNFLGAYGYSLTEIGKNQRIRATRDFSDPSLTEYFYDSRGLLTETAGSGGVYKVQYYREDLPRYWERRPMESSSDEGAGNFYLQWDERGLLLRVRDISEKNPAVDYRYEYTLDGRGNWIERREIRMMRSVGLLVPSPGTVFRRVLEYRE